MNERSDIYRESFLPPEVGLKNHTSSLKSSEKQF